MRELNQFRCFLLDLDGTFYLGNQLLPGALEFIHQLEKNKTQYLFLTNNSSKSRLEYVDKLHRLGLDVPEEKIFTSGEATALYIKKQKPAASLYVVGTPALEAELNDTGSPLPGRTQIMLSLVSIQPSRTRKFKRSAICWFQALLILRRTLISTARQKPALCPTLVR